MVLTSNALRCRAPGLRPVEGAADLGLQLVLAVALDHPEHREPPVGFRRTPRDARDSLRPEPVLEEIADCGTRRALGHAIRGAAALPPLAHGLPADAEETAQLGLRELEGLRNRIEQGGRQDRTHDPSILAQAFRKL